MYHIGLRNNAQLLLIIVFLLWRRYNLFKFTEEEHVFGNSWVKGDEYTISDYTMYALWEISGVIYIDNGTTLEPYLAYIDNGTDWELYLVYVDDGTDWNIIS